MTTLARLRWHAGLEEVEDASVPSLADLADASWENISIDESFEDALCAFETFNHELNGAVPSSTISSGEPEPALSRMVVYAACALIRRLRSAAHEANEEEREAKALAAWRLEIAWMAILDGDIDDLREHIAGEEWGLD